MSTEKKVLAAVLAGVALLVVFLMSSEVVEREISPKPTAAHVAIEIGDSGVASTGPAEMASGTPFRLHAVLEAETFSGETIYYTEAKALRIDGQAIAGESLRVWDRSVEPRILWFTVEGFTPFMEIEEASALESFRFQDNFRADWPRTWTIPGDLKPRGERDLKIGPGPDLEPFGTQRYHVRIEIFGPKSEITPELRLQSLRGEDLPARAAEFATVTVSLPGPLEVSSRARGLTQIEPRPEILTEVAEPLTAWYRSGLTFSRLLLLREMLDRAAKTYDELEWTAVELGVDQQWGASGVGPGDLLRVGNRWVIVLADRATHGILERDDLCLDFDKGLKIRQIGEVFTGDGLIEWTRLERATASGPDD